MPDPPQAGFTPSVGTHLSRWDLGPWKLRVRTNGFYQLLEDLGEVVEGADVENVLGVLLQQDPVELHGVSSRHTHSNDTEPWNDTDPMAPNPWDQSFQPPSW